MLVVLILWFLLQVLVVWIHGYIFVTPQSDRYEFNITMCFCCSSILQMLYLCCKNYGSFHEMSIRWKLVLRFSHIYKVLFWEYCMDNCFQKKCCVFVLLLLRWYSSPLGFSCYIVTHFTRSHICKFILQTPKTVWVDMCHFGHILEYMSQLIMNIVCKSIHNSWNEQYG